MSKFIEVLSRWYSLDELKCVTTAAPADTSRRVSREEVADDMQFLTINHSAKVFVLGWLMGLSIDNMQCMFLDERGRPHMHHAANMMHREGTFRVDGLQNALEY